MWSHLVLCLFVGLAYATTSPAWKQDTEYVYTINGRTLSSLHEAADQYSGILFKADLHVILRSDGKLQGKLSNPQYARIQSQLIYGWNTEIPDSQISYQSLALSQKPFQMVLEDGLITKLIVEKELTNWEANMIKGIVSQFQLDLQGKNVIDKQLNDLPVDDRVDGVYSTMEETVSGETETLYELRRLPEYLVQSQPWLVPHQNLRGDGDIIEVYKFKNHSNAEERPVYHYGFAEINEDEPAGNNMGQFLVRDSSSRAIITGKLSRHTIQNTYTINKILVKPDAKAHQMGSIISMVNATLSQVNTQADQPENLKNPIEIGCLVYTYDNSFSEDNKVHKKIEEQWREESGEGNWRRFRRSMVIPKMSSTHQHPHEKQQQQERAKLSQAQASPLLPRMVGYHGKSIKQSKDFDVKENVKTLVQEISADMEDPEKILSESTLNKYTILNSLVRLMDDNEIKSVAENFYPQQEQNRLRWAVFRDSVAEAGTGPALNNIQQWIESNKIQNTEAAEVISTMSHSVRLPTEEYMKKFFELIKSSEVRDQKTLNNTAILSYAELAYKVYINDKTSHNEYPVHAFGSFYTKEGREYIKETVIPYFTQQLDEAVSQGDSIKVHVYTRALGNIGHRKILAAFEPYLEGQKQASQFQRMWMVASMDKLAYTQPAVAQSVFFRIYQNPAEVPEVRVLAAIQIIGAQPSIEMLQHMAQYTNIDAQEKVNAAVKHMIEAASRVEIPNYRELRKAAQSAKHLLTRKEYGQQKFLMGMYSFMTQDQGNEYFQHLFATGSEDSNIPSNFGFGLDGNLNGMSHEFIRIGAAVSNVKELTKVLFRQTDEWSRQNAQRSQQQTKDSAWSSAKVAKLMNYVQEEKEQLEAVFLANMEHIHRFWSINNQTLEQLPEVIRKFEEELKNGKSMSYSKLRQREEKALSYPTEMGLPFVYTYDMPLMMRFEGKVKAVSTPQISNQNKLNSPEQLKAEIDAYVTVSAKIQSHLSFVAPFENQIYQAGYEKNAQIHVPVKANVELDLKNKRINIEYEVQEKRDNARMLHISHVPYTSRSDISDIKPVALRPNTLVIKNQLEKHHYLDIAFSPAKTGLAFRVWGNRPVKTLTFKTFHNIWNAQGIIAFWDELWDQAVLEQSELNFAFVPSKSTSNKVAFSWRYANQYKQQPENPSVEDFLTLSQLSSKLQNEEAEKRQEEIMKHVGSGIQSAYLRSHDFSLQFQGSKNYRHIFGLAYAKSNADSLSKMLVYHKNQDEDKEFSFEVRSDVPNTNGLDMTSSLDKEPSSKYIIKMQCNQDSQNKQETMVSGEITLSRSQARKQYLKTEQPMYYVCKEQMERGNYQLPACQNMTIEANYLDDIKFNFKYDNLNKNVAKFAKDAFKVLYVNYYPMTETREVQSERDNTIEGRIQFQPQDLRQMNVTVQVQDEETKFYNISLRNEYARAFLVSHPVFHLPSRMAAVFQGRQNYRPTCVIDQTAAQTFSNKTYPLSLDQQSYVVFQYVPRDARVNGQDKPKSTEQQIQERTFNYIVIVRQTSDNQKEVIVTVNHPKTEGASVEIHMKPVSQRSSNVAAKVTVNGQELTFTDKQSANLYNGYLEVYALPNGEVKLEIQEAFYLIFDGKRVKLTATDSTLQGSIYGLCGRFTDDQYEDFTVPSNCVVSNPKKFVQNYVATEQKSSTLRSDQCLKKVIPLYVDVITDEDVERTPAHQGKQKLRTRYVEEDGDLCFTIHPLPVCETSARRTIATNVPVHCIQATKAAYYFKSQIDQGGNPDFSRKAETKSLRLPVPLECN